MVFIIGTVYMKNKFKFPKPLHIPIYGGNLYLFKTQEDFQKAYVGLGGEPLTGIFNGNTAHFEHSDGGSVYLLGWYNDQQSTLAHECVHAAIFLFNQVGMDPSDSNGEAMAYLVGFLVDAINSM